MAGTPGACSQVFCHPISGALRRLAGQTPLWLNDSYHTHHTGASLVQGDLVSNVCRQVCLALAGAMECHGERGSGAALRRRERRPRAWQPTTAPTRWRWTTPYRDRARELAGRRWSTRSTPAYGHRRPHLQGSGQASLRSLGRRGATAPCGAPQGKLLSSW